MDGVRKSWEALEDVKLTRSLRQLRVCVPVPICACASLCQFARVRPCAKLRVCVCVCVCLCGGVVASWTSSARSRRPWNS